MSSERCGSSCSIQVGKGLTDAPVGSLRNVYLVVADLEAARSDLLERGIEVGEIRHKTPIGAWDGGFAPGLDPGRVRSGEGLTDRSVTPLTAMRLPNDGYLRDTAAGV